MRADNASRLRDGEFDHLVHYVLQSTRFTSLPPIEPALSAKAFIESLPAAERASPSASPASPTSSANTIAASRIPDNARARLSAFVRALPRSASGSKAGARLTYFRSLLSDVGNASLRSLDTIAQREYVRAMRFLYEKEFVAGRSTDSGAAVASLYQKRGLSSDTSIEAGYGVYAALGTLKQLEPERRITRVLIVGPGLDLAPRTALVEEADPQSYQPFAVADALLALGLATRETLRIDAVDLNPHVTMTIARAARTPDLRLFMTSDIADDVRTHLTDDYRAYVDTLGRAIGSASTAAAASEGAHLRKILTIAPDVQQMLSTRVGDLVADSLVGPYDLIVVTNVFPYLSDPELIVALANINAALAPRGVLVHNERREVLLSMTKALGFPAIHARTVQIATVPGGQDLYDAIWLHRKQ